MAAWGQSEIEALLAAAARGVEAAAMDAARRAIEIRLQQLAAER